MSEREVDLEEVRQAVVILQYVKKEKARLRDLEAPARAIVEDALQDNEFGRLDGTRVVKWRSRVQRRLSQVTLRTRFPDVAAECMETIEQRSFELLEPEEG